MNVTRSYNFEFKIQKFKSAIAQVIPGFFLVLMQKINDRR